MLLLTILDLISFDISFLSLTDHTYLKLCICIFVCVLDCVLSKCRFLTVNFKLTRVIRYIMSILMNFEDFYSYLLESVVESMELSTELYLWALG